MATVTIITTLASFHSKKRIQQHPFFSKQISDRCFESSDHEPKCVLVNCALRHLFRMICYNLQKNFFNSYNMCFRSCTASLTSPQNQHLSDESMFQANCCVDPMVSLNPKLTGNIDTTKHNEIRWCQSFSFTHD